MRGAAAIKADAEEAEAKLIETYLPEQLSDEELSELVSGAVEEAGASEPKDMGGVMKVLMPKVGGRAGRQAGQPGGAREAWRVGS